MFGEPEIAHFYLPLLDPLKTPHLFQYPIAYIRNPFEDDRPCFLLPPDGGVEYASRHFLLFHQSESTPDLAPVVAAFDVMAEEEARMRGTKSKGDATPTTWKVPLTIVEVIVALDPHSEDPLSDALDEAIESIRDFQLYYHLETKVLIRRLTRKALPQIIPVLRRPFGDPSVAEPTIMLVNEGGASSLAAAVPEVSTERLNNLLQQTRHRPADIFKTFIVMRQEARLAFLGGDYTAASLFCGISAEALLTELILMLLWEEDEPLDKVAGLFGTRDNISNDLLNAVAQRLHGNWDRNGTGPIGQWQKEVADLRNRVAHLGTVPSEAEIQAAFDAVQLLERFVGDRLVERRNFTRYSQTARNYLNGEGFARRNRASTWNKFAAAEIFPAHASLLFTLWKREVDRIRNEPPVADPKRAITILVAYPNGARRWYLVDEEVDLACEVEEPAVNPAIEATVQNAISSTKFEVVSIHLRSISARLPEVQSWRPSYEYLPMKSIHRWNQCLWQPPAPTTR